MQEFAWTPTSCCQGHGNPQQHIHKGNQVKPIPIKKSLACFLQHDSGTAETFITWQNRVTTHTRMPISSKQSQHIVYSDVVQKPYADWMLCFSPWKGKENWGSGNPQHRIQRLDWTKHKSRLNGSPYWISKSSWHTGSLHCTWCLKYACMAQYTSIRSTAHMFANAL